MYNNKGFSDLYNDNLSLADFIEVDTLIVNNSLTTPNVILQGSSKTTTTIQNVNPTVNTVVNVPDPGITSTNFILQDCASNQHINSGLVLGSVTSDSVLYTNVSGLLQGIQLNTSYFFGGYTSNFPMATSLSS